MQVTRHLPDYQAYKDYKSLGISSRVFIRNLFIIYFVCSGRLRKVGKMKQQTNHPRCSKATIMIMMIIIMMMIMC